MMKNNRWTPTAMLVVMSVVATSALANGSSMMTINQLRERAQKESQLAIDAENVATADQDMQRLQQMTQWTKYDQLQSDAWKMTKAEWLEYKKLMAYGPNAAYYRNKPELNPLVVMGINAKSDSERRDYAQRGIELERERLTREIAFDEAWNGYIKELTANHPIWMSEKDRRSYFKKQAGMALGAGKSGGVLPGVTDTRVVIYVDPVKCDRSCRSFIASYAGKATSLVRLDLFAVGGQSDDELLSFGQKVGITEAKLDARAATLNHDNGSYARITPAPGLPVAYRVTTGGTFMVKPK